VCSILVRPTDILVTEPTGSVSSVLSVRRGKHSKVCGEKVDDTLKKLFSSYKNENKSEDEKINNERERAIEDFCGCVEEVVAAILERDGNEDRDKEKDTYSSSSDELVNRVESIAIGLSTYKYDTSDPTSKPTTLQVSMRGVVSAKAARHFIKSIMSSM